MLVLYLWKCPNTNNGNSSLTKCRFWGHMEHQRIFYELKPSSLQTAFYYIASTYTPSVTKSQLQELFTTTCGCLQWIQWFCAMFISVKFPLFVKAYSSVLIFDKCWIVFPIHWIFWAWQAKKMALLTTAKFTFKYIRFSMIAHLL